MLQIRIKLEVKMVIWLQKPVNQGVFTNLESIVSCHRMGYLTFKRLALIATTTVLTLIKTAPAAGLNKMPIL